MSDSGSVVMPFGKFKGERLAMLRESYLVWLLENCEKLSRWLREAIEFELEARKITFILSGSDFGLCGCPNRTFWNTRFPLTVFEENIEAAKEMAASRTEFNFIADARRVSVRGVGWFHNYLDLWPECSDLIVVAKVHELFYTDSGLPFP